MCACACSCVSERVSHREREKTCVRVCVREKESAHVRACKREREIERERENVDLYIVREVLNSTKTLEIIMQHCESKDMSFFSLAYSHKLSFSCKFTEPS